MREYEFHPKITEAEWLTGTDIKAIWPSLPRLPNAPEPDRLVYLLTVAICQPYTHLLRDSRSRKMIEVAEACADGLASADEMWDAEQAAMTAWQEHHELYPHDPAHSQATVLLTNFRGHKLNWDAAACDAIYVACFLALRQAGLPGEPWSDDTRNHPVVVAAKRAETTRILNLLRDIYGNPFRPVAFSPEWHTDTAVSLARTMYESREFGAMPILADALQDAGCDNTDILDHCRDPRQVHVRGCWVIDLVLGKS